MDKFVYIVFIVDSPKDINYDHTEQIIGTFIDIQKAKKMFQDEIKIGNYTVVVQKSLCPKNYDKALELINDDYYKSEQIIFEIIEMCFPYSDEIILSNEQIISVDWDKS